jgi:hypothetical protein
MHPTLMVEIAKMRVAERRGELAERGRRRRPWIARTRMARRERARAFAREIGGIS